MVIINNHLLSLSGNVQYVMYVPNYVSKGNTAQTSQDYSNVAYTTGSEDTSTTYQAPQAPHQYTTTQSYQSYKPQFNYIQEHIIKQEPKSLLDSYIPSYLQVQYYNRQQQQNYVQEPLVKVPRKSSHKSVTILPSESTLRYQSSPYKSKS